MKKKFLGLFSAFLLLISISSVSALELTQAGDNVVQEGNYDSIRLVAGEKVTNKANVDGLSLIAGNDLVLEGSTPYGFYAGNTISINENIEKDMFVAGNIINIGTNAIIGRDAYIAGSDIKINSDITRDLRAGGNDIDISDITIGGDAYIASENITMNENTVINGTLTYPEDANVVGLDKATIGSIKTTGSTDVVVEFSIVDIISSFVFSSIAAFITMVLLFTLIPKVKEKLDGAELTVDSVVKKSLVGLAMLIIVPIVSIIALFTRFLTPIALIALALYVICIYISSLLVYYIIGKKISIKLFNKEDKYIALIVGIVCVKIIKLIPIIGGLIGVIVLFYGMGLIYYFIESREN